MTITPVAGTDDVTWLDAGGVRQSSLVVIATNPDGTAIAGGGGTAAAPTNIVSRGAGSIATNQVTVAATATSIVAARAGRSAVIITNLGTTDVFVGIIGVSATTGALLAGTKGTSISIPTSAAIFGIVATGTQAVSFLEVF